jgi:hypothetical protein
LGEAFVRDAYQRLQELLLEQAPTTWELVGRGPFLSREDGPLVWVDASTSKDFELCVSATLLKTSAGSVVAIASDGINLRALAKTRFLGWYETGSADLSANTIVLVICDINGMQAIQWRCTPRKVMLIGINTIGGELARFVLSTDLRPGRHIIKLPEPFKEAGELLLLAQSTAAGGKSQSNLCLFILRPAAETVEVIPQDWFNEGLTFDYGYEAVTRVARDPRTRKIVGDGVRLEGIFVLDGTNRQVERWCRPRVHLTAADLKYLFGCALNVFVLVLVGYGVWIAIRFLASAVRH